MTGCHWSTHNGCRCDQNLRRGGCHIQTRAGTREGTDNGSVKSRVTTEEGHVSFMIGGSKDLVPSLTEPFQLFCGETMTLDLGDTRDQAWKVCLDRG